MEQIITGLAGLAKMADFVSDLYFIKSLSDFDNIFEDAQNQAENADKVPVNSLIAFAIFFFFV
jgi:hypothetical protein